MFCPRCRIEYTEGYTECPECGAPLVEELPPEPEAEYVEWVTVLTTVDQNTVMVATSLLEDAGIRVNVRGEGLQILMGAAAPKEVQVMPENVAQARLLLEREGGLEPDEE
ncbi:MAG: DUF2007 domain-containing protein [Candidatus Hydrogenedentes bacterium]|nr:DUF2007 domain-containing protein [Candidatus Hydrogenedentota bacterium]